MLSDTNGGKASLSIHKNTTSLHNNARVIVVINALTHTMHRKNALFVKENNCKSPAIRTERNTMAPMRTMKGFYVSPELLGSIQKLLIQGSICGKNMLIHRHYHTESWSKEFGFDKKHRSLFILVKVSRSTDSSNSRTQ